MIDPMSLNAIGINQLGNLLGQVQGNYLGNSLAQYQAGAMIPYDGAQQLIALQNQLAMQQCNAMVQRRTSAWERERAKSYAADARSLVERIAFWRGVAEVPGIGWLFLRKVSRLADKLDAATAEVERCLEMAAKIDAGNEQGTAAAE